MQESKCGLSGVQELIGGREGELENQRERGFDLDNELRSLFGKKNKRTCNLLLPLWHWGTPGVYLLVM